MIHACPKPRRKAKRKPKPMARTRMKTRPSKVVRDRERMAFCASLPCVACLVTGRKQQSRTHAHHVKTRGAGGKEVGNLAPLCGGIHHDELHRLGRETFETMYGLDLTKCAADVEYLYRVQSAYTEAA